MKNILYISFMVLLIAGASFLVAFTNTTYNKKPFRTIQVEVINPSDKALITEEEINGLILEKFGRIEGASVSLTDLSRLESTLLANPYISKCEVFLTLEKDLEIKTMVRKPLVRIINEDQQQFYLDYQGYAMPLSPEHPSRVIIANGFIKEKYISPDKSEVYIGNLGDSSVIHQIYRIAWLIARDEFLHSFIDQIYINENKEIELVPKIGRQAIIFGDDTDAGEKLENLRTFYLKFMSQSDWNVYKTINIKYKNQVVCSKNK